MQLELALDPRDGRRLAALLGSKERLRRTAFSLRWHDSPEHELARARLALAEWRQGRRCTWLLWQIAGRTAAVPGTAEAVLAEAEERSALPASLPAFLGEVARFEGRSERLPGTPAAVSAVLLRGSLRAGGKEDRCCRLLLTGPGSAVAALALRLAADLRLRLPERGLAAEALAAAGSPLPEPPPPAARQRASDAIADLLARLTTLLLQQAGHADQADPEPVHQMRITVRRLRSALTLFRKASRCAEARQARAGLRTLAGTLAEARDWDVFVGEAGAPLLAVLGTEAALARLLQRAERRRLAAYRRLARTLAGPEFRQLGITLALLAASRPWEAAALGDGAQAERQAAELATSLAAFATAALERRRRPLTKIEGPLTALPAAALHKLRLRCKRLRYAAEFFAPLFGRKSSRRFIRRLAAVQEHLGRINDAAVAGTLLARLGTREGFAGGLLRGFLAARAARARRRIDRSWRRFCRLQPFWH